MVTRAVFMIFLLLSILICMILSWTVETDQYARNLLVSIPIILTVIKKIAGLRPEHCRVHHSPVQHDCGRRQLPEKNKYREGGNPHAQPALPAAILVESK